MVEPLPHLETFAKAAELSNFTAAARELGLSQAAVSQRMQALERALETPLFHRQGGQIFLTEAGQRLFDYAQRIIALHEEARREVTGKKERLVAHLALAASSIPGEHVLPQVLADFRKKHPHIQIRATISDSAAVCHEVEQGHVQLGLIGSKTDHPALQQRVFAHDQMTLVVPANHPWAKRKRIPLEQFFEQSLIVREAGSGSRACLEQALTKVGRSPRDLKIAFELGSNEAIKEMVQRGGGVAVMSVQAVGKELTSGELHQVAVADLELERDLYVVWDTRRALSIPAQLFLDFLGTADSRK